MPLIRRHAEHQEGQVQDTTPAAEEGQRAKGGNSGDALYGTDPLQAGGLCRPEGGHHSQRSQISIRHAFGHPSQGETE